MIVLDSKYAVFRANNDKDNRHTRHIARRIHFVKNGEKCNMHKIFFKCNSLLLF